MGNGNSFFCKLLLSIQMLCLLTFHLKTNSYLYLEIRTFYSYLTKLLEESLCLKTFWTDLSVTTALNIADSQIH